MLEGGLGRRRAALAAVALAASAETAEAFNPKDVPLDAPPSSVATEIHRHSLAGGIRREVLALSYQLNGRHYTVAAIGGLWGIPPQVATRVMAELDKASGRQGEQTKVYSIHNHSAELMISYFKGEFGDAGPPRPNDFVLGPSTNDCDASGVTIRAEFVVNLIIEPGGWWVCSSAKTAVNDNEVNLLRNELALKSQEKSGSELEVYIEKFRERYRELSGIPIEFVRAGATDAEIEAAAARLK